MISTHSVINELCLLGGEFLFFIKMVKTSY